MAGDKVQNERGMDFTTPEYANGGSGRRGYDVFGKSEGV